jgi:hypothetical protein
MELRWLGDALADIGSLLGSGEIDPERAWKLIHIHHLSVRCVLCCVEGLGLLAADEAVAVMCSAGAVRNRGTGFAPVLARSAELHAHRQGDPVFEIVELFEESAGELEQVRAAGFSAGELPVLRTLFVSQRRMFDYLEAATNRLARVEVAS